MSYGINGEAEWEGLDSLELEDEAFNDGFDEPQAGSRALSRIDSETAAMLMDVASHMAAEAESEEEADAFLPLIASLAPMALRALAPLAKSVVGKFAPTLSRGVLSAGRKMLQNVGREGMAALPGIVRGVARDTVQAVADGRQVSGEQVMRSAAQHTLPFLQDPRQAHQAAQQMRRRLMMARRRPQPAPYFGQPYPQMWGAQDPGGGFGGYGDGPYAGSPYGDGGSPYGNGSYGGSDYGAQGDLPPAQADGSGYPQW
jgi:hypothetical protein